MSHRRVVITGLGWVTSLGIDVNDVFDKLVAGTSGITEITRFNTDGFVSKIGGEVRQWDGGPHLDRRTARRLDRFGQFALSASIDAVNDAGIDFANEDIFRCGSIIGSGVGGIEEFAEGHEKLLESGPERVSPFMVPKLMCNAASGNVSIHYGLKGPNTAMTSACASAAHAIGESARIIRYGDADVIIAGGSEAACTPLGFACFIALKALSRRNDEPQRASRPFDKDRDGFILAEGAGIVVLEEYERAKARGARIYAEVTGFGQSADGSHITAPDETGSGAAYAMQAAIRDAKINTEQIDYINPHGTSTPLGDLAETRAIKNVFGDDTRIPVSSTKSMTGHLLGASGGVEAIALAKAIERGVIPPTINLENPDAGCDLDYVPNAGREVDVRHGLTNSFGFGGHNVSLVFSRL